MTVSSNLDLLIYMKIFFTLVITFAIGFLTNKLFFSEKISTPVATTTECQTLDQAKSDLIKISEQDYLEYTNIKTLKEKYEKADELLGKVMLLFLADVGFKSQKVTYEQLAAQTCATDSKDPAQINTSSASIPPNNNTTPIIEEEPPIEKGLANKGNLIAGLTSSEKIRQALDQAEIKNIKLESSRSRNPNLQQAKILEGIYAGTVSFFDKSKSPLNIRWELTSSYENGKVVGSHTINITGNGKDSNSSGRGELRNISILSQDSKGYLIDACGGDCYLQLYYNSAFDRFYGNYYENQKSNNKFYRAGLVEMSK